MDDLTCDRFDDLALDLLYEDGDAAARQLAEAHAASCPRCGPLLERLVADREHARLPRLEVPEGLEARIMSAALDGDESTDQEGFSLWRWLGQLVSVAGSYAMRPQAAMAVLLMMMVGSSLLLLRARPAGPGSVQVTKEGAPHSDEVAPSPVAPPAVAAAASAAPEATDAAKEDAAYAAAMDDFKGKRFAEAIRGFDIVASGGGANAGLGALYAARSARYASGCGSAIARFDAVASRYVGTPVAVEAMWDAAICYREVGNTDHAKQLFSAMKRHAQYRERAEKELQTLDQREAAATATSKASDGKPAAGAGKPAMASPKAAPAAAPTRVRSDAY